MVSLSFLVGQGQKAVSTWHHHWMCATEPPRVGYHRPSKYSLPPFVVPFSASSWTQDVQLFVCIFSVIRTTVGLALSGNASAFPGTLGNQWSYSIFKATNEGQMLPTIIACMATSCLPTTSEGPRKNNLLSRTLPVPVGGQDRINLSHSI